MIAAAFLLLTSCSDEKPLSQELPEPTEALFTEIVQTVEPTESETEAQTVTESASETVTIIETQKVPETTEISLPYRLEADEELDFSSLSDQTKTLRYDEFYQEILVFQDFYPEYSEGNALHKNYLINSEDQLSRYKELFAEALQRNININGREESSTAEYQQAIDLIDNMTGFYPSDDYVYLAECSYDSYYLSKYTAFIGMDIVVDGEMLKLIRRYETTDNDKLLHEETLALEPPQYLWVAAVPREFLPEDNYTDWQQ